jgi:hypothetical protein
VGPAAASLRRTAVEVEALLARVERVRKGFECLPRESDPKSVPATEAKQNVRD